MFQRDWVVEAEDAKQVDSIGMADVVKRLRPVSYLSTSEVVIALEVSRSTVIGWIDEGLVEAINVGRNGKKPTYKISRSSLLAFLKKRRV